jgi:hypothetical protein
LSSVALVMVVVGFFLVFCIPLFFSVYHFSCSGFRQCLLFPPSFCCGALGNLETPFGDTCCFFFFFFRFSSAEISDLSPRPPNPKSRHAELLL